jgi:pimeloyl-ACP methyl ester carboxylesterase
LKSLARDREVFAVDLPGFGNTAPLSEKTSVTSLADSVSDFLAKHKLIGVDVVGSGLGARIALELLQRRNILGGVVALAPTGFWPTNVWPAFRQQIEQYAYYSSQALSVRIIRQIELLLPMLTENSIARTILLSQLSAHPSKISQKLALKEMSNYAISPAFDEVLDDLAFGEIQNGCPRGSVKKPLVIGWGRQDRICFPDQAEQVQQMFPDAKLYWFENCGHFPHWDEPARTVKLILETLGKKHLHIVEEKNVS